MYLEGTIAANTDETIREKLINKCRDAYERACNIHHTDKPFLHLRWSFFEESQHNITKAAEIIERIDKTCPNIIQIAFRYFVLTEKFNSLRKILTHFYSRRVSLERRRGDFDKCTQLYESYVSSSKSKTFTSTMAIKYSRYLSKLKKDPEAAIKVLKNAITKEPTCQRLYLQLIDISLSIDSPLSEIIGMLDLSISNVY
jgi:pre-mRNA-processing factor 39